jgi:hypothetical protein
MSGLCPAGSGIEVSTKTEGMPLGRLAGTAKSLQSANFVSAQRNARLWRIRINGTRGTEDNVARYPSIHKALLETLSWVNLFWCHF